MTHKDLNRAADAVEQITAETVSVIVAIKKGNGQIVITNIGDLEGRQEIYKIMGLTNLHMCGRITMNSFKEDQQ